MKKKIIIRAGTLLINHKKLKTFFLYLMKRHKSNHFPIRKILEASLLKSNKRKVLTSLTMMLIHIRQLTSNHTFNNHLVKVVVASLAMIFLVWISQILLQHKFQNLQHKIHHKVKGEK